MVTGSEAAVVVTVTETGVVADPFSATELGTTHVDSAGPPVQVSATVWLKPPAGETATV
jgi:hypothetical protein